MTSITTEDNKIYALPEELQSASLHTGILKPKTFVRVKKKANILFDDQFLEELNPENLLPTQKQEEAQTLEKNRPQNLRNVAERFVLEKFTNKNINANQWINVFEKENMRFDVRTDKNKIEILRLFMDKCNTYVSQATIHVAI
ncbi:hypothetical protein M0802_009206 [Mischocyttarus mexicanus]|nr:hypothetical protein M0802_009206 [Mischocyttarus mexicanus]